MPNSLATSNSPYLRQHADNPVAWRAWSPEAFAEAKRRDVPVLVSIGYATCHWCHVMAHECFEDGSVASFMNLHFVCIKVDREEHPEVDAIYMDAVQAITGQGGWPLNAFTDADGRPFFACTYLPPRQWLGLLDHLAKLWREERTRVLDSAGQLATHLARHDDLAGVLPVDLWTRFDMQVERGYDAEHPGMAWSEAAAPKFPAHQVINALITGGGEVRLARAADMLTAMQDAGLHDRVGGGFHRYSVTRDWRLPHFEKMLYDNAQLMASYARAGVALERADFIQTAVNIGDYLLRDLRVEHAGAFVGYACAEDADDPNGEGSFYAWSPAELEAVLGAEIAATVAREWNVSPGEPEVGPHGHVDPVLSHIPHPRGAGPVDPAVRATWEAHLSALRARRDNRPRPIRDDKVLTDQNGLALEGFAWLARATNEARFIAATAELADVLIARQRIEGLLRVVYPDGTHLAATITDYGALVAGLMAAFNALGDPRLVRAAAAVADEARIRLRADDGSFFTAPERADLIRRGREVTDNAWPAGQASLALGCARLWAVTGEARWHDCAHGIVTAAAQALVQAPAATATLLVAAHHLRSGPATVVVTGGDADLLMATRRHAPDLVAVIDAASCVGETWSCLEGRRDLPTGAHVCTAGLCHAPATTPAGVRQALVAFTHGPA